MLDQLYFRSTDFICRDQNGHYIHTRKPNRDLESVVANRRLTIHTTLNVKAKFRCPLPGKVEMSAFAVLILFPKLLKRRSRDSGRIGVLVP
jgi:hypothetical protein